MRPNSTKYFINTDGDLRRHSLKIYIQFCTWYIWAHVPSHSNFVGMSSVDKGTNAVFVKFTITPYKKNCSAWEYSGEEALRLRGEFLFYNHGCHAGSIRQRLSRLLAAATNVPTRLSTRTSPHVARSVHQNTCHTDISVCKKNGTMKWK